MKRIIEYFFGKEGTNKFAELLKENQKKEINEFLKGALFYGIIAALLCFAFLSVFSFDIYFIFIFCLLLFFAPLLLKVLLQFFESERRKRKKEKMVPDVLLQASIFPCGTSTVRIIDYLAKAEYGLLSDEFRKAGEEIKRGAAIEQALLNIKKRCKSRIVERAINLLVQGHNSGAEMSSVFKEAAEDILETQAIIRERNATMIIEKYTLLLASGIIVPLVLGLIVGLVQGMDFSGIAEFGIGTNISQRKELLGTALIAIQAYIAEYSIIASVFVSNQEGNIKKAIIYALILLPLSLIVFSAAKTFY